MCDYGKLRMQHFSQQKSVVHIQRDLILPQKYHLTWQSSVRAFASTAPDMKPVAGNYAAGELTDSSPRRMGHAQLL